MLGRPGVTIDTFNKAMADTFVQMNTNETLGSLENPPVNCVDVVLANPPYVTQGSGIYRKEIAAVQGSRNGIDLSDYYDGCGMGVESLFLRYISGCLKPGGRGFVIVPLGMLNRTEPKPKRKLLDECNILASISLPSNTFFNTSQATSILVIEKRHTPTDPRPNVLCAHVRSIGETLDVYRHPDPENNDLAKVADYFLSKNAKQKEDFIKIADPSEFTENDRWDVSRFWSDEEMVSLGVKPAPVGRNEYIGEAIFRIGEITNELEKSREELDGLTKKLKTKSVKLNDDKKFLIRSGIRIKNVDIKNHPGNIPVYSCFKYRHTIKGEVSEEYLIKQKIKIEDPNKSIITIAANGSVGTVFLRKEKCMINDDLIAVEVLTPDIDPRYLAAELRRVIDKLGYRYEAKLFKGRVKSLTVEIPLAEDETFDLDTQQSIADAQERFDAVREKLCEVGKWSQAVRIERG
jgi:hypothetical protein